MTSTTLLLLIALAAQDGAADDWPHFRGPELDGSARGGGVFDGESLGFREHWRAPLGPAYSGVAIAAGHVVTASSDGDADTLQAFRVADGAPLWTHTLGPTYLGHDGSEDGVISSPVIGRGKVYVVGPLGELLALGLDDGELAWSVDLVAELGAEQPEYGFAMTALLEGGVLIVHVGGGEGRALCGFDPDSGELVWSVGDGEGGWSASASPIAMSLGGVRQLVALDGEELLGVLASDGTILWRHTLGGRSDASAGVACPMGDDRFFAYVNDRAAAFQVRRQGEQWSVEELFRSRELGNTWAAPVYHEGHLYGFNSEFLTCVNAANGKRVWKSRPPGGKGLILVDDRLVVFGAQGAVVVAAATPEGYVEELRGRFLEHSSFTWPSFAGGRLYVRNSSELVCIQLVQDHGAVAVADPSRPVGASAFGRFVESVAQSEDKAALVDAFFADQASFPLVEDGLVHVVYRGEVEDVAVAGTLLDEAQPRALERLQGTNVHYRSYPIEPGARWEYALQVDFGDPIPDPLNPRTTPGIIYDGVGNVSYEGSVSELVPLDHAPAAHLREPEGERGRIETYEFESEALGNRRSVQVYLPAGYEQGEEEYPLLIVHRGPEWLEQGVMTNSLDNLIGTRVRPLVVAFVSPIGRWWYEAGGTGTEEYIAMLAEEFVPDIERRYRLSSRPEDRGLTGVEAFGLTAAYGVLLLPDVFGKAGVQSAALSLNGATGSVRGDLARQGLFERLRSAPRSDSVFYVDWNRYEKSMPDHSIDLRAEGRQLSSELRAQGYQVIGGEALDTHGWGSWRGRTDELLVALFPL